MNTKPCFRCEIDLDVRCPFNKKLGFYPESFDDDWWCPSCDLGHFKSEQLLRHVAFSSIYSEDLCHSCPLAANCLTITMSTT